MRQPEEANTGWNSHMSTEIRSKKVESNACTDNIRKHERMRQADRRGQMYGSAIERVSDPTSCGLLGENGEVDESGTGLSE
jgi:hypothetical protein